MARKIAAGNWKMNGLSTDLPQIADLPAHSCDVILCPPATLIDRMVRAQAASGTNVHVGGQDCHANTSGAHTGDLSAAMIGDAGGAYVILGHSERREDHGESDADVNAKVATAQAHDLTVILCIGESEAQYKAGETLEVVRSQLAGSIPADAEPGQLVIAYEPIWAIGTGLIPTMDEIEKVHGFIRAELEARFGAANGSQISILYGGSVKPGNAAEIFAVANVDGALVGGASLKAADFGAIITALDAA